MCIRDSDMDTFRPLVEQYIATLPADAAAKTVKPEILPSLLVKAGEKQTVSSAKMQTPQTYAAVIEYGNIDYTPKTRALANVAGQILSKRFLDKVDAAGIKTHIMAGIIPLKAAGMARYMNENVPGIAVPQDMIDRLAAAAAEGKEKGVKGLPMQLGIEMAAEMIARIKDEHLCDGVHIMAIGAEKNVPTILEKAGVTI